jgi:hypothetical protein
MQTDINGPRTKNNDINSDQSTYSSQPDSTPRREGGDDALAESSPADSRSDEKVIVNEQRGNKTVNAPSQTAANTSEGNSYDDEIIDEVQDSDE